MKRIATHTVLLLGALSVTASSIAAENAVEGAMEHFLGEPHLDFSNIFRGERFPNIVVTTKGTLLASWGTSSVRVRRSEDGGETWGEPITIRKPGFQGGGLTVDENSGDILAFVEEHHPPAL